MKTRLVHMLYLTPAVLLLLVWIVAAPSWLLVGSQWTFFGIAVITAMVVSWSITLFIHAVIRDKQ